MNISEISDFLLNKVPLFAGFSKDKIRMVAEKSIIKTFGFNESLIKSGEDGKFLGILVSGKAEATIKNISGESYFLGEINQGEIFGEMALLSGEKTSADVTSKSESTAIIIPKEVFAEIMVSYLPAVQYLTKTMSQRTRHGLQRMDNKQTPIPVEISAHHVHLSREHVDQLFGAGHKLTPEIDLSQPGQYACKEKVNLIGAKGRIENVRVLGPERKETQVEIAMTEKFRIGINPPIRESGVLENSPGLTLEGTNGKVEILKGVICALRHIHMTPDDAKNFEVDDKYIVRVRIEGDRELIFGDVIVRVNPNYKLAMHLDTDEGNAANISTGTLGYIDSIQTRPQ